MNIMLVDKTIIDEVSRNKRNLVVAFMTARKHMIRYDMIRWKEFIHRIPEKVENVLRAIIRDGEYD